MATAVRTRVVPVGKSAPTAKTASTTKTPAIDLVVAHQEEKLDWLPNVRLIYILHKGTRHRTPTDYGVPTTCNVIWIRLNDVGLCVHSWLWYCRVLRNDSLGKENAVLWRSSPSDTSPALTAASKEEMQKLFRQLAPQPSDTTIFVAGEILPAGRPDMQLAVAQFKEYASKPFVCVKQVKHVEQGRLQHNPVLAKDRMLGVMHPSSATLRDVHNFLTERHWPIGGIITIPGSPPYPGNDKSAVAPFGVSNARILAHDPRLYDRAISLLDQHPNPEEAHLVYKLLFTLFGDGGDQLAIPFCPIIYL